MLSTDTKSLEVHFSELAGQLAEMCSFNRSLGQIYGILYMSPEPLSLEDIAKGSRMSKGNASVHLRTLQGWEAVHRTWKSGSRKDYYAANRDIRGLAMKRLHDGIRRRLDLARVEFSAIRKDPEFSKYVEHAEGTFAKDRVAEIESLIDQVEKAAAMLPKLLMLKSLF
jgi:DNA-binding transcriptional regulator GbsR (MarR family)